MTVSLVQNFFKQTVTTPWTVGTGNFYVSQKPSVTSGFLVISPNSESLREIVSFSAVGTDGGGDYVTVSARGLGGTTEQAHGAGEKVYMNITAQHVQQIKEAIEAINNAGALNASTTVKGVARLTASPNVSLGNPTITIATPAVVTLTAHGLTENDEIQFTTSGALPTGITPAATYYVIGTGLTANTFQFSATFGGAAVNTFGSQSGTHTLTKVTPVAASINDTRFPTTAQASALLGAGEAPGALNKFLTQGDVDNNTLFPIPVVRTFTQTTQFGSSTTQFDISLISGTTYRYTWDGTGTDPTINTTTVPTGTMLYVNGQNFAANNKGYFTVTGSGVNYFEVTNASGSVENNVTLGTGQIYYAYIPPIGLKFIEVELQASGGNGAIDGGGGGGGAYAKKIISLATLGTGKYYNLRANGVGGNSIFDTILTCGNGANAASGTGGAGGTATGGDININGQNGMTVTNYGGAGGHSLFGFGGGTAPMAGSTSTNVGHNAGGYGGGGGGSAPASDGSPSGATAGTGTQAVLIITEHYS